MKNEPAFPTVKSESDPAYDNGTLDGRRVSAVWSEGGLTKRELFAVMALQGLASNGDAMQAMAKKGILEWDIVADAVRMADSLLAELEKK